jgi:hypothetical protein
LGDDLLSLKTKIQAYKEPPSLKLLENLVDKEREYL